VKNWLKKLFGGEPHSNFQADVLQILQNSFPDGSFKIESDSFAITAGQMQFSLKELQQKLNFSTSLEQQVVQHFAPLLGAKPLIREQSSNGSEFATKIFPWLVPPGRSIPADWIITPFHYDLSIAYCIESETTRTPIHTILAQKWGVDSKLIHERSILNLKSFRNLKLEVEGPEPFIGIELKDGHDAVRILLSEVREFAAAKLGEPFLAGIPSRDFLILWSMQCSNRFHDFVQEKIDDGFNSQAFPLTTGKFQATRYSIDPV
jgi:hypothetical protein